MHYNSFFVQTEKFKQMEIEKKKTRPTKRVYAGPTIRYHSLSMPLIEEIASATAANKRGKPVDDLLNESGVFKMEIE